MMRIAKPRRRRVKLTWNNIAFFSRCCIPSVRDPYYFLNSACSIIGWFLKRNFQIQIGAPKSTMVRTRANIELVLSNQFEKSIAYSLIKVTMLNVMNSSSPKRRKDYGSSFTRSFFTKAFNFPSGNVMLRRTTIPELRRRLVRIVISSARLMNGFVDPNASFV